MRRRYCLVVIFLLLLLGSAPLHCAAQKAASEVPPTLRNKKMISKQYRHDPLKKPLSPYCRSVVRTSDQVKKGLATIELMYRKAFSHLPEGPAREHAVASSMFPIKIFLKQRDALEAPGRCNRFEKWIGR